MGGSLKLAAALLLAGLAVPQAFATQGCGGDWTTEAASFAGEAYGSHEFTAPAGPNTFVLKPQEFGWTISMRDANGQEMAVFSPPVRPVEPNPVHLSGWHFRNLANTGVNTGDVNAPQLERSFFFGELASDPTLNPLLVTPLSPRAIRPGDRGRGELVIEDMGLADLTPGRQARLVYLKFRGCIEWSSGRSAPMLVVTADPEIPDDVADAMAACGVSASTYRLSGRMGGGREGGQHVVLRPDMDGDYLVDLAVPVTRIADGAPGLAICLSKDRALVLAGFDGRIGRHLDPEYFGRTDWWNVHARGPVGQSADEGPPPVLTGDAILMGKEGASSVLVYLDEAGRVASYWQGD